MAFLGGRNDFHATPQPDLASSASGGFSPTARRPFGGGVWNESRSVRGRCGDLHWAPQEANQGSLRGCDWLMGEREEIHDRGDEDEADVFARALLRINYDRAVGDVDGRIGIHDKSERGHQEMGAAPAPCEAVRSPEIASLLNKRQELSEQKRAYNIRLRALRASGAKKGAGQLEFDLGKPCEMLFSSPLAVREATKETRKVDRFEEFGKTRGLHAASDHPKRMKIEVKTTEITYDVETVTDFETGKSVRASTIDDGPAGFQLTWESVGNLVKMHVGFAIPIHRIALMIGQKEFSTSKICRIMQYAHDLAALYGNQSRRQLRDQPLRRTDALSPASRARVHQQWQRARSAR